MAVPVSVGVLTTATEMGRGVCDSVGVSCGIVGEGRLMAVPGTLNDLQAARQIKRPIPVVIGRMVLFIGLLIDRRDVIGDSTYIISDKSRCIWLSGNAYKALV